MREPDKALFLLPETALMSRWKLRRNGRKQDSPVGRTPFYGDTIPKWHPKCGWNHPPPNSKSQEDTMYSVTIPNPDGARPATVKLTETRYLNPRDLRSLCIRRDWYTRGTCAQYDNLLEAVRKTPDMTTGNLYIIAKDILDHSNTDQDLTGIMYDLAEACVTTFEIH